MIDWSADEFSEGGGGNPFRLTLAARRAGHVLCAAHRRLDHAVSFRAFRYLNAAAVVRGERVMDGSCPHRPHVMFTLIPHLSQVYAAMGNSLIW